MISRKGRLHFESLVHPDDLKRVGRELEAYTKNGSRSFQQEYRLITSDQQIRWVDDHTWVRRGADGEVVSYQGVLLDVTARKQAEEERTRLAAAMEQAAEAIVLTDQDGRIQYVQSGLSTDRRGTGHGVGPILT